jgi:hypothetical protein
MERIGGSSELEDGSAPDEPLGAEGQEAPALPRDPVTTTSAAISEDEIDAMLRSIGMERSAGSGVRPDLRRRRRRRGTSVPSASPAVPG